MSGIVVLAGHTRLARAFLQAALAMGLPIKALLLRGFAPAPRSVTDRLPVQSGPGLALAALAAKGQCACLYALTTQQIVEQIQCLDMDYVLSVCFPTKIPGNISGLANIAGLNAHPSLLPAYRGPCPLFWQFRDGRPYAGITLHVLSDQYDRGPIVLQRRMQLPPGISKRDTEQTLAELAVAMLAQMLQTPFTVQFMPQDEQQASYQGYPDNRAFHVSVRWPAERIYRFICGTQDWGRPYWIKIATRTFKLHSALDFDPCAKQIDPLRIDDGTLRINCQPGVVHCRLWAD